MPDVYYDSTLTGQALDEALRGIPASVERAGTAAANAEKNAKTAESWAQGGTGTREGEETDNAEYWARQAKNSSESAAADSKVVRDNLADIQIIGENLTAIQNAPNAAERAEAAAESALGDADRAELAADRAQSIGQGALGYYPTPDKLQTEQPNGQNGQWAIVGSTDTIWVWDGDTSAWTDSGQKTDLSQYYTKDEADEQINELQETLAPQIAGATSRRWVLAVTAEDWQQQEDGRYTKTVAAEGMTADTKLSPGVGAKPVEAAALDERKAVQAALGCISELEAGDGAVTLTCYEQAPETAFNIIMEEVR